jgi:hypothetical protein
MIMELDALLKLNVKTVCQEKDVGLSKMLKFIQFLNMEMLADKKIL